MPATEEQREGAGRVFTIEGHSLFKNGEYYASVVPPNRQVEIADALEATSAMLAALEAIHTESRDFTRNSDMRLDDILVMARDAMAAARAAGIKSEK